MKGAPTWVELPEDARPEAWSSFKRPVCPLRLALYGHPDAGGYWEKHCHDALLERGMKSVPDWPSVYFDVSSHALLMVYVDDFKAAGPPAALDDLWARIRPRLQVGEPGPVSVFLGCT